MTTIKKSINTTTKKATTVKTTGNSFTLKDGVLTLKMSV